MNFLIGKNEYFSIEHSYSCAVPGYLIVTPGISVASITELPLEARVQLGPALASAAEIITGIVKPVKIYCARYGEEDARIHFYLFPRTAELTTSFIEEYPEQKNLIHGPILFDWARSKYGCSKEEVWSAVSPVNQLLKARNRVLQTNKMPVTRALCR